MKSSISWIRYKYGGRGAIQVIGLIAIFLLLPLVFRGIYYARILNLILIFALFAIALNLIFAHSKQLFLCQGALAGMSAYMSTLIALWYKLEPWLLIPLGVLTATIIGTVFSYVSVIRRLEVIFIAIITLLFTLIFDAVVSGLEKITYGTTGFVPPELTLGPLRDLFGREWAYYYMFIILLLAALIIYRLIIRSRMGMALAMISDDEVASEASGVNVKKYKVLAASIGSAIIGLTGALYAYYNAYVMVTLFTLSSIDIMVLVMLMFGGRTTALGPVLGSVVFTLINEALRPLGPLTVLFYGLILMLLFAFFREGLVLYINRRFGLGLI